MRNAYRTIDEVLRKHQAIFARSSRAATTDRILRSTKLEDGIYADLRAGDEALGTLEGEAQTKLSSNARHRTVKIFFTFLSS